MDIHSQAIFDEYIEKKPAYELLREVALDVLNRMISENGIFVTGIEARVKTADSLQGKLELKGGKYNSLSDITDIVGARVITFYSDEVDRISALAETKFTIDWENSVDKRKMLQLDQFGYQSLHYICTIPKELYFNPEYPEINEMKFELQMRTALQHVWATIHHDLGYKTNVEVPAEYKRSLTRLAGLLEIADEEFEDIRDKVEGYRARVRTLVKDGKFEDIDLNGDSFKNYLAIGPFDKLNARIAGINQAELQPANLSPYLEVLRLFGMKNLGQLEKMKAEYSDDAFRLAKTQLGGRDIDILSSSIGLQNLCIIFIVKKGVGVAGLKKFFDVLNGEKPRNINSAERTMRQVKDAGII